MRFLILIVALVLILSSPCVADVPWLSCQDGVCSLADAPLAVQAVPRVAPVRTAVASLARAQPVRSVARGVAKIQPVRRAVRGVARIQPLRRVARLPLIRRIAGRR